MGSLRTKPNNSAAHEPPFLRSPARSRSSEWEKLGTCCRPPARLSEPGMAPSFWSMPLPHFLPAGTRYRRMRFGFSASSCLVTRHPWNRGSSIWLDSKRHGSWPDSLRFGSWRAYSVGPSNASLVKKQRVPKGPSVTSGSGFGSPLGTVYATTGYACRKPKGKRQASSALNASRLRLALISLTGVTAWQRTPDPPPH